MPLCRVILVVQIAILQSQLGAQTVFREYDLVLIGGPGNTSSHVCSFIILTLVPEWYLNIATRYLAQPGQILEGYDPTLEETYQKRLIIDDVPVHVNINNAHDYQGFRSLRDPLVQMGEGFLLVYSIANRNALDGIQAFHERIQRIKGPDAGAGMVIVGNKCDLEAEREVSTQAGRDLARELNCSFIETSAMQGTNVEEAFIDA
ncbi:Ras protein [Mycena sanguinolenta]|uniref:Ras protein n=1 Tax=Mycena sanguinolenta TaxID=230812 RepID=A0A8H6Y1S1_9AGAR|nr:Ras protein [Mycena sanguinolenta]